MPVRFLRLVALSVILLVGWRQPAVAAEEATLEVAVSSRRAWTDTGLDLRAGQHLQLEARGRIRARRLTFGEIFFGSDGMRWVGPSGTYLWPRTLRYAATLDGRIGFPLPAAADGPHPAYALIGRIGEAGEPFYLGAQLDAAVAESGRLWLGVNDVDLRDNEGSFRVSLTVTDSAPPARDKPTPPIIEPTGAGQPAPEARVLLLYVDGLRPDVVHEMAAGGFLPVVQRLFLDGGVECAQAFTVFPSNTLVANGALFTGLLPDRTGLKSQNQFERTLQKPVGQWSEWLPDWPAARPGSQARISDLLDKFAPESTWRFLRRWRVRTLDHYVRDYRYTVLPIAPMNPPPRWLHQGLSAIRNPFAGSSEIPQDLDRVNTRYVVEELLDDPEARVIAAWFPMVDKISHHAARGQFGAARREIAEFDRCLGRMVRRVRQLGLERSMYYILVSDHGHSGGEERPTEAAPSSLPREWRASRDARPNRRANLARDFFHRQLGCNVKVVGQEWRHPGSDQTRFVFVDHQAWGQAAIFLPKARYHDGLWELNTLPELMRYDLGPNRGQINLLDALMGFRGVEWDPSLRAPVDVLLARIDAQRVLVARSRHSQAVIHMKTDQEGVDWYRYEPIDHVELDERGALRIVASSRIGQDPLGYAAELGEWLGAWHTDREWLERTGGTAYPDAVSGFAKCFAWKPPMDELAASRTPDLVVTAAPGWSFRSADDFGTDHGGPLREAMRISLWLAGPNVRHGVMRQPRRIVDVLPTILQMVGQPYDPKQFDGLAIEGIYE